MDKVFIVTSGTYSDYHICGVFDSREKAEKFIAIFSSCSMEVEEWSLNPFQLELSIGYKPFSVEMGYNGDTFECIETSSDFGFTDVENSHILSRGGKDAILHNRCFAKDGTQAIKITNELRTRLIAEDKWRV